MCDCPNTPCVRILSPTENLAQRLKKLEKALSEEMGKTREMDDILAGVVKRVGYVSGDESEHGEYIRKDELAAWLDEHLSGADILLQFSTTPNNIAKVEGVIDAYKSVKAHIEG